MKEGKGGAVFSGEFRRVVFTKWRGKVTGLDR